ncbi:MAG: hypothetical protein U0R26_08310 [Solirubrobacterales bacterium]
MPHYKAICRADFSHRVSTRLDEQGLYWFTGGLVEVDSSRRRHHLEVDATDREEALHLVRKAIEAAGGDAGDLNIV